MANPKRVLFIAGEVTPFAAASKIAALVRSLPEQLQDAGNVEARVTMPRYGTISERKHNLHEVIRLSGTKVPMGDETETLTVKVASIPGTRLQVYFMDSDKYFKRKGLSANENGSVYEDNAERALFFGRAVLETISKLRWGPDIVHAFGWMSSFVPTLLRTDYAGDDVLGTARAIYTPDDVDFETKITEEFAQDMQLSLPGETTGQSLTAIGRLQADAVVLPPSASAASSDDEQFSEEADERGEQLLAIYERVLSEVHA